MAKLPIVRLGHPALRTPAPPVPPERIASAEFQRLIDDMIETMRGADGVGLAATQVGLGIQLFVYAAEDPEDPASGVPLTVAINPAVEPVTGDLVEDWEGCLSIPDLRGLVPRHLSIVLRALDREGKGFTRTVSGFEARIVQHEFDHLNGIVFLDRMRDLQSLAFLPEWERFFRAGEEVRAE